MNESFSLGSARASRANFGASAEISCVPDTQRLAGAPIAPREGACAPQIFGAVCAMSNKLQLPLVGM